MVSAPQVGFHIGIVGVGFKKGILKTIETTFLISINHKNIEYVDTWIVIVVRCGNIGEIPIFYS